MNSAKLQKKAVVSNTPTVGEVNVQLIPSKVFVMPVCMLTRDMNKL